MDPKFWRERWQKGEIGFHSAEVQPALVAHWPGLGLAEGASVFVPLAGKSLDMAWLADQGYRVIGVELSEIAIDAFFAERGVTPEVETCDGFTIKSHEQITLWCGDIFALTPRMLPKFDAVYDRAALIALPPDLQPRYAAKLAELMPPRAKGLLLGIDYDTRQMEGPPFATPETRVRELLSGTFDIALVDVRDGPPKSEAIRNRGVTRLQEAVYRLERRA
jgi:thiopurine S-methyltransferase